MLVNKLFDLLDDWRNLPAYQLERRADIFFALYLETILEKKLKVKIDKVIPEFPIRIGELPEEDKKNNRSFKIDYFAFSRNRNEAFLIELKTDQNSRSRKQQDRYLENASKIKLKGLIKGLIKIFDATTQKVKYRHLLGKVEQINLIKNDNGKLTNTSPDIKPVVIYIQPLNLKNEENIISFEDVIGILKFKKDPLTERFVKSLRKWKTDPNKK